MRAVHGRLLNDVAALELGCRYVPTHNAERVHAALQALRPYLELSGGDCLPTLWH